MVPALGGEYLVFDTSPLSHMAKAQLLGVLRVLVGGRTAILTEVVERELRDGAARVPALDAVLSAQWLVRRELSSSEELRWYAVFGHRLIGLGDRNRGEASVLAWAKANGNATAVLDDMEARKAADEFDVPKIGTLGMLVDAVNKELIARSIASALADEYLASLGRLPFGPGGFIRWAQDQDLFT